MLRPRPTIACCLCGRTIPRASAAYALDGEWERRFPRMTGMLAWVLGPAPLEQVEAERLEATDRRA